MNSLTQISNNNANYLANGETAEDFNKLKAFKIKNGTFYTGPFSTPRGNPHFGNIQFLGEYIFLTFSLYYLASNNYKFATFAIICYIIGSILNGIRFYYVNSLVATGDDAKFIMSCAIDNVIRMIIALVALIYIYLKK
jgi:hypothetical protein